MNARAWAKIRGPVDEVLAGFVPLKRAYVREHEWVAEMVLIDSSAFSKEAFYVHAFVQPLFLPEEYLILTHGWRVGSGWDAVKPELVRDLRKVPRRLAALAKLRKLARDGDLSDPYHAELRLCMGSSWTTNG